MKKIGWIILSLLIIAVITLMIIRANSLKLALSWGGYSTSYSTYHQGYNANQLEYKVIEAGEGDNPILIYLERNRFGFWKILYDSGQTPDAKFAHILWMNSGGFKKFAFQDDPTFSTEWNYLAVGTNAVKQIELSPDWLRPGTAFKIQQTGESYSIYLITFTDPEDGEIMDIYQLLLDKGMIK
ncbi:hypothetical protein ASD24_09540 [Paenibacillus sp. Root52]|uniref:Uncharacterized protein n=1 Tax=Paenibacillus amylolyticus TaxID=1451 RepID=A0AAP5LPW5_PAEAM|nr:MULTISPECIES: hypothetical protein [Paenibacillus]KQY84028.1 hypothetical protein ASD24_09540 [Paenibacillus sp. Root52]MDR6726711.1 hypothetical protein [Paenibacillus amylolyticus]